MQFDFESLTAEPLIYMLMHSGAFVVALGSVCCIVGLLFGYATWGRYKSHTRELRGQVAAMKGELADLKRKVADHSVKSGPAIAMATETIHMPRKDGVEAAEPVPAAAVAPTAAKTATPPTPPAATPATPPAEPAERTPEKNRLPKSRANVIKPKVAAQPEPPVETPSESEDNPPAAPPAEPPTANISLSPAVPPPAPARHTSPLAAIIAAATPPQPEQNGGTPPPSAVTMPMLPELPADPLPARAALPFFDLKLGLIYQTRPRQCDDLTALKGIAQTLEQRLHEFGVYTYAQIASWNEDQIREFSTRLAFKDRIQRERWVEQAQQLLAQQSAKAGYDPELGSWGR